MPRAYPRDMIPPHRRADMAREHRRYDRHGNYRGKTVHVSNDEVANEALWGCIINAVTVMAVLLVMGFLVANLGNNGASLVIAVGVIAYFAYRLGK